MKTKTSIELVKAKTILEKLNVDAKTDMIGVITPATINAYLNEWKVELLSKYSNIRSISWDTYNEPNFLKYRIVVVLVGENQSANIDIVFS